MKNKLLIIGFFISLCLMSFVPQKDTPLPNIVLIFMDWVMQILVLTGQRVIKHLI